MIKLETMQNRLVDSFKLNNTDTNDAEYKSVIDSYKGEFKLRDIFPDNDADKKLFDEKIIINRLIHSKNGTTEEDVKTNKDILLGYTHENQNELGKDIGGVIYTYYKEYHGFNDLTQPCEIDGKDIRSQFLASIIY